MKSRLEKRGTETEQSIAKRCENALGEVDELLSWREKVNYRIFNDDLELAKKILKSLLLALYPEELNCPEIIAFKQQKIQSKPETPELYSAGSIKLGLTVAALAAGALASYLIAKRQ